MRYETVGRYINDQMPPRAVFFTMLHSGSVRYYSGRMTIRYDLIPPERFEATVTHLRQRGYTPFSSSTMRRRRSSRIASLTVPQ